MPESATSRIHPTPLDPTTQSAPGAQHVARRESWLPLARCRLVDPELFFPLNEQPESTAPALAVCAPCPVREQCLADVLAVEAHRPSSMIFGVCGGLSPSERRCLHPFVVAARVARSTRARGGDQR